MSKRLTEAQKSHRQSARFWARQVRSTIESISRYDANLAWYQKRLDDPAFAAIAARTADCIAIEERRLIANAIRAAHAAGLAIDNLWTR